MLYCAALYWMLPLRLLAGTPGAWPGPSVACLLAAPYSPRALAMISLAIDSGTSL